MRETSQTSAPYLILLAIIRSHKRAEAYDRFLSANLIMSRRRLFRWRQGRQKALRKFRAVAVEQFSHPACIFRADDESGMMILLHARNDFRRIERACVRLDCRCQTQNASSVFL